MNTCRKPLVYLIILNYKGYRDTCECVDNLLQQDYGNYKILIVDNDSQDESYEKLKVHYPELEILPTGKNLGYAGGNNIGIRKALEAGAEYVGVLNNDIKAEPDMVTQIVRAMEANEKLAMAGPAICEWDSDIIQSAGAKLSFYTANSILYHKGENYRDLDKEKPIASHYLGGAALFVRTSVLEQIGLIPECYFLFFEETEWCVKANRAGLQVQCIPQARVWHKESSTVNKIPDRKLYYQDRNRVIFERRNATKPQFIVFVIYDLLQIIVRKLLRRHPTAGFKAFFDGVAVNGEN